MGKFHFFSNIMYRLKWASLHIFGRSASTYTVAPRQRVAAATLDVVLRPTDPSQPPVPPSRGCFAPYSRGPSGTS